MPHFLSSLSTEAHNLKQHPVDFISTSIQPTDPYTTESIISSISNSSNLPSCTYKEDFKRILLPAVYTVVFVLGIPLNAIVIRKIWKKNSNLIKSDIFMLNLALADFLYVMSLPLLIYNYASRDYWPFGEFACKLVRFQFYSNLHGSILFLTCISVHRYVGICHPLSVLQKQIDSKMTWWICGGVWVVVIMLCAPTFFFAATGIQRNRTVCYELSTPERSTEYYPYGMVLTFLGFLLPFIGVLICNFRMAHSLCQPVSDQRIDDATRPKREKAGRLIIVILAVFCLSFLPFHLTKTMYLMVRTVPGAPCEMRNLFSIIYKCTRPFASMNSFLDPILFYFTKPKNRQSTRRQAVRYATSRDKSSISEQLVLKHGCVQSLSSSLSSRFSMSPCSNTSELNGSSNLSSAL